MNDLNVSTLVMMLDTNIRMNPRKLDEMFEVLEPIDYNANNEGVVKISVRGKHKGCCKKMMYQKSKTAKNEKKTFQNQLSFYVRVFESQDVTRIGESTYDEETSTYIWSLKKGQTAFQCNSIQCTSKDDANFMTAVSSINRKSIKDVVLFENKKVDGNVIDLDSICYSNEIKITSNKPIENVKIGFVIEVNMFVFTSGKTKVAGCTSNNQIENAMRLLMNCLSKHLGDEIPDYLGVKSNDFKIISKAPVMINSDFKNPFEIKRFELDILMRDKYKLISTYEPCTHPAVIIKYYCNDSHDDSSGRCLCRELYNNDFFCKGRGDATKEGGCKSVTILIFQSGKVIITGGRVIEQVHKAYNYIKNVLKENRKLIERVENED
jgi:TATA-box binding protein (TBP) (component of TFIID and TFIIIB)|tara:strand:- start:3691 stop:4824 length:1134 start_codon:yes stop_codon:yes gene_type:complete